MKFIYMNKEREENKMTISERILKVLKDRNMTQAEFAKQVGIATSTISEWKKERQILLRIKSWIFVMYCR